LAKVVFDCFAISSICCSWIVAAFSNRLSLATVA
jgi:hypothetical protein